MSRRKLILTCLATGVLVALCLIVVAFVIEPSRLIVNRQRIEVADARSLQSDLKVAVIADFHTGSPFNGLNRLNEIVSKTNAENPDLILLLGDYLISGVKGGTYVEPKEIARELGKLSAPLGVYSVLGNHDWWEDGPSMTRELIDNGIPVLENESQQITFKGKAIWIIALADDTTRQPDYLKAFEKVPVRGAKIVISHDPGVYLDFPQGKQATVLLAGHTHGGQVYLPWLFNPVVPGRSGPEWAKGLKLHRAGPLFITSGLGTSIIPVRFNNPPEIVILTLSPHSKID